VVGLANPNEIPAAEIISARLFFVFVARYWPEPVVSELSVLFRLAVSSNTSREEEIGISWWRVRELEYELEERKLEAIKERTRLLEETAELSRVIHAANLARMLGKKSAKGKRKVKECVCFWCMLSLHSEHEYHDDRQRSQLQTSVLQRKDIMKLLRKRKARLIFSCHLSSANDT
jgi:hypothetical protein